MSIRFLKCVFDFLFLTLLGAILFKDFPEEKWEIIIIIYTVVLMIHIFIYNFLKDPKYNVMLYNGTDLILTEAGIRELDKTCVVSIARHVGKAKKFYKYRKFGLGIHPRIKTIYRGLLAHRELGIDIFREGVELDIKGILDEPDEYDWVVRYCVVMLRDLYKIGTDKEDTRFLKRIRKSFYDRGYE